MPTLPKVSLYSFDSERKLPFVWTNDVCYDFLDHMLFLAEQEVPPYYIPLCCGLDKAIEKQPYNYESIRQWIKCHIDFVRKIWQTTCI